jgi:hypothetical protein
MAHIISGQTEMIEHVDVLGLFLHVRTNIVRWHLNKLAYNNLQFSRTAIAEKQYFLAKQNIFNILMQEWMCDGCLKQFVSYFLDDINQ